MRRFYQRLGLAVGLLLPAVTLALISSSSVLGAPLQAGNVNFTFSPASHTLDTGQTVDVTIQFDATTDPVSAAQVYIDFDKDVLQVVDASGNPTTTINQGTIFASFNWTELQNSVDNGAGTINFAGGKNPPPPNGNGADVNTLADFATFKFKAIDSTPTNTTVTFDTVAPRQTKAVSGFSDVTGTLGVMTITVLNTAPTPLDDNTTVPEGGTVTTVNPPANDTSLLANDTDPENDTLVVTTTPVTPPANGSLTVLNTDGTFSYTHDGGETTSDSFVYEVCDLEPLCATATVNITVTPVNDDPTAVDDDINTDPAFTTDEDTAFTTPNVLSNDTDPDLPAQTLSVQSIDTITNGTLGLVTDNGDGTFLYDPNGQFESLNAGDPPATDSFNYTVSDGNGGTDTATVTITITGVDEPQDVTFTVSLQGASSSPSWSMPVEAEIYHTGTTTPTTTGNFTVSAPSGGSSGTFMVSGLAAGDYDVWVKVTNALSSFHTGLTVSESSISFDLGTQLGGDASSSTPGVPDNVVEASDYSGLLGVFGQLTGGLTAAEQLYDFNQDAIIDVSDYTILVGNFGQGGDAKP